MKCVRLHYYTQLVEKSFKRCQLIAGLKQTYINNLIYVSMTNVRSLTPTQISKIFFLILLLILYSWILFGTQYTLLNVMPQIHICICICVDSFNTFLNSTTLHKRQHICKSFSVWLRNRIISAGWIRTGSQP